MASHWWILLAVMVYSALHSVLASLWVKAAVRRRFGSHRMRAYRLAYNIIATVTLLPILALPVLLPDKNIYSIPTPWLYLTLAGQAFSVAILVISLLQTGALEFLGVRQLFDVPDERKPQKLILTGFYRWVRHPLYFAGLLFIWLSPVMTRNLLALYVGFTLYLYIGALFEEHKMLCEFGEAYRQYKKRTPMLMPGFRWEKEEVRGR